MAAARHSRWMDRDRRSRKRSDHALKALVENAVEDVCQLRVRGLAFRVDAVEISGRPPERIAVWATLHFTPSGSPFCCGEPDCHMGLRGDRLAEVQDRIRRAMGLEQAVVLDLGQRVRPECGDSIGFHYGNQEEYAPSVEERWCGDRRRRRAGPGRLGM